MKLREYNLRNWIAKCYNIKFDKSLFYFLYYVIVRASGTGTGNYYISGGALDVIAAELRKAAVSPMVSTSS